MKKLVLFFVTLILISCSSGNATQPTATNIAVTETKLSPTSISTNQTKSYIYDESTSSNGEWDATVSVTKTDTAEKSKLVITNRVSKTEWVIESISNNEARPYSLHPYIFKWSNDGKSLYFSYLWDKNDGCFGYFKPGGFGLEKLNLLTGEVTNIREETSTWMALSPDEKHLAYIDDFDGNVSIFDIELNESKPYNLPTIDNSDLLIQTSDLYWSPDGNSLVYAYYVGACDLIYPYLYVIQLFPETGEQVILLEKKEDYYLIEWSIQDKILLEDKENKQWWLDIDTLELLPTI